MAEWVRAFEDMKSAAIILFLIVLPVAATEGWEAICEKEGGCKLITVHAYDAILKEIAKLNAVIIRMKKEQCA